MNWKHWLKGLWAAFIGGAATAFAATQVAPLAFNFGDGLHALMKMAFFSGLLNAAFYLKQSPVPPDEKSVVNPVTIILALIAIPVFLSGCAIQRVIELNPETKAITKYTGCSLLSRSALDGLAVGKKTKTGSSVFTLQKSGTESDPESIKAAAEAAGAMLGTFAKTAAKP